MDDETASELDQFSWEIESISPYGIKISLKFDYPESVSSDRNNP